MPQSLKLMAVLAHPDDESLGMGGTMAKYAAEGIETYLLTATRGEKGWFGADEDYPGMTKLGKIREQELHEASDVLGLQDVILLDYLDGELDKAKPDDVIPKIVHHIREIQPDVIITFDPFGAYGHPDHIAICQFTTAAITCAADPSYSHANNSAHRVSKLYYRVGTSAELAIYEEAFGELVMQIDGTDRRSVGWEAWAITTKINTLDHWQQVWQAVSCHQTQLTNYESLKSLPENSQRILWNSESYYRAMSLVNSGREQEADLFAGLH